ncbi:hypothetical protein [Saccharothrix obliqua]|uniref:hypothetical protein n=1 Tax=Saccharothrix obliqua TaxID=2861747 RepID=UPI001C6064D1|nr:hypothetical protein [Saccharothrix obliqua]MBW4720490.1 hypothetical protein [Saccharothrix obliqua]
MTPDDFAEDRRCQEAAARFTAEFGGRLSREAVTGTVLRARADLEGQVVPESLDEMLHRLAKHRLADMCAAT